MQSIWPLVTILGPALLLGALVFVTIRNRLKSTPESEAMTERATKQQREAAATEPKEVDGPLA